MSISCVLLLLLLVKIGYKWQPATATTLIYAFATACFPFAQSAMDPAQVIVFTILTFYCLILYSMYGNRKSIFVGGMALGAALLTRAEVLLMLPGFLLWGIIESRNRQTNEIAGWIRNSVIAFIIGIIPFVAIILWYNFVRFGSIFETGFQKAYREMGIGIQLFSTQALVTLYHMLLSPRKSLFLFSPILIMFPFFIVPFMRRKKSIGVMCLVIIGCWLYFYSLQTYGCCAEYSWGQRYLVVIIPFLTIPLIELFARWNRLRKVIRVFIFLLIVLSVFVQLLGVSVSSHKLFLQYSIAKETNVGTSRPGGMPNLSSPIRRQWQNLCESASSMRKGEPWNLVTDSDAIAQKENLSSTEVTQKARSLNVLNFWWVHLYYIGFSFKVITLTIMFLTLTGLTSGILLKFVLRNIQSIL